MATGFSLNPMLTTNAAGTFNIDSNGMIQGLAMDSPAIRNTLAGGVVAQTSPGPMWGGMAITTDIPTGYVTGTASGPKSLGPFCLPATAVSTGPLPISAFTVFDQAHHMIATPQSAVPLAVQGMSVHFYRLGTGARIPLACDPSLITLQGGLETQQVSWDFYAQRLIPFVAAYAANNITNATYNQSTGVATYTTTTAHGLVPGQDFTVTGFTPAGYNGSFTAVAGTTGSTITAQLSQVSGLYPAMASPATVNGSLNAGGGALPVRILEVNPTNCMTVQVDPLTGFATWNRNGACALALI